MEEPTNLSWVSAERRFSLAARRVVTSTEYELVTSISENDMRAVQQWCEQNQCGRRISYDTFQFRNKREMAFFLLKWSLSGSL